MVRWCVCVLSGCCVQELCVPDGIGVMIVEHRAVCVVSMMWVGVCVCVFFMLSESCVSGL